MIFRLKLLALSLAFAALSQDSFKGAFVFSANSSGNWDLFLYRAGQGPEKLTGSPLDERSPALSSDGKKLAYITSDGALWFMDLAMRATRKIGDKFEKGHYGYPTWTPDGKALVYTVYTFNPPTEDGDIHTYSFADSKYRLLVNQTGPQDYPAVSPDGNRLAYMSSLATLVPGFGATVTQQLWVVSLTDGKPRQLFFGSARDSRPVWSPDGRSIAFSSDRTGNIEIWLVDSEGTSAPVQLTAGPGSKDSPAWSPDGDAVAFIRSSGERSELVILDVKEKRERVLSPFRSATVQIRDLAWR
jgi:TolB protein